MRAQANKLQGPRQKAFGRSQGKAGQPSLGSSVNWLFAIATILVQAFVASSPRSLSSHEYALAHVFLCFLTSPATCLRPYSTSSPPPLTRPSPPGRVGRSLRARNATMPAVPMDIDTPAAGAGGPSLSVSRALRDTATELSSIISSFRPTKLFAREAKDKSPTYILSLDFDDPGELCMTSESDDTIQIYNVKEGRHDKALISKKYGAKLARFTHWSNSIVYASTKQNDAIRYLATHDNSFIRYFEGHEASVTSISMHPGSDNFVSTSQDGTVRLWNVASKQWTGLLYLNKPYLSAWDPSGNIFAVGSPAAGTVLLYDHRNYTKPPFSVFDVVEQCGAVDQRNLLQGWTKLDFSNDGKHILVGTRGAGHFLLDAFDGKLKAFLRKTEEPTRRVAAGEGGAAPGAPVDPTRLEGSGDCCFTPDGRYVIGGTKQNVMVWDTLGAVGENKVLNPAFVLEDKREAAVVAFNPRFNFFATADQALVFWLPDANA